MDRSYLRFAAVCAAALAVTTLLVWWLITQVPPAPTFEDRLALASSPYNLARYWVSLLHMVLGFAAMLGVYFVVKPRSPGFAAFAIAMIFAWMLVEMVAMSIALFGVNLTWRSGFAAADPARQAAYRVLLAGWPGVFEGLYFVLVVAFAVASFVLGLLAWPMKGIARVAGAFLLLGGLISVAFLVSGYGGPEWPGKIAGTVYPVVQPAGRALLAVWLWRVAAKA